MKEVRLFRVLSVFWLVGFLLVSFSSFSQSESGKKKPKANPGDCEGNCFTTEVLKAEVNEDGCVEYELKVSSDGSCRYDLSHYTVQLNCGTVSSLSNSRNWKQSIGKDPTTGLDGFKIDDIPSFGKDSDNTFIVNVTVCGYDSTCLNQLGVAAYKAGQCVDYDTLNYEVVNPNDSTGGGDNGGSTGGGDGGNTGGGDDGGSTGGDNGGSTGGGDNGGSTGGGDNGGSTGGGDNGGGTPSDSTQTCSTLLASLAKQNVTCFGLSNGEVTVAVQSGNAPFTYKWSNGSTDSALYNIPAGNYAVTITDADGNTVTLSEEVTQPSDILISASVSNPSCNGSSNGSIDISVTGGSGSYTYAWNTGATTQDISNLPAGLYTITVTDATTGCTKKLSNLLSNALRITLSAAITKPACNQSTGGINLTVNPAGSYTFSWSNGATTEDIQNVPSGSYSVIVTDANGCQATGNYTVVDNNAVRVEFTVTPAGCSNEAVGAIDVTVTGGAAPFTYSWQNGPTTEDLSGLTSGIYRITVTDANGCSLITPINVPKKTIQVNTDITQPLCSGDSTGSITVNPIEVGNYTYTWSNGETSNTITNVPVGTYTVTVTDESGCSRTLSYTITQPAPVEITSAISNSQCGAEGNYSIDITVTGGKMPYTYSWSTGGITQDLLNVNSGTYSVSVTDANGCSASKSITIESNANNWACIIGEPSVAPVCGSVGNTISSIITDANTYSWSITSSDNSWAITAGSASSSLYYTAGTAGSTATFTLTISKDGCTKTCSYTMSSGCVVRDNNGGGDPNVGDPCSGETVVSNDTTSTTTEGGRVAESEVEFSLSAYPNPFDEVVNLEFTADQDDYVEIEILDQFGNHVKSLYKGEIKKGETYSIECKSGDMKDRLYFYRYSSAARSKRGKLFRR